MSQIFGQLPPGLEHVTPDEVFGPDASQKGPLDPCPSCGATPFEAPEGVHDQTTIQHNPGTAVGDPQWNFPHCWKCGYRPGVNVAISQQQYNRAFENFKAWYAKQLEGMTPQQVGQ